ncbi:hypothetical protein H0E87_015058 [Populus deltoides]|uniref:Bet v I/Major latex protein domain-containing protein n=1 Tax=Populus deltoides TaxID=3696 RepID=A0A8T2Y3N0_POPDE|nr:hypothetical protein H0E87_015058 [Populus deltoides]
MGVFTYESEASTVIPPARLFKALFVDAAEVMPKALPQAIKSIVTLEGDGGPGTIKQTYFGDGSLSFKERTDAIDKNNFSYAYTVFEGDALANTYEKIFNESKIEASLTEDRCARPAPHTTLLATWTQKQMKLRMDKKSKWDYSRPLKPTC